MKRMISIMMAFFLLINTGGIVYADSASSYIPVEVTYHQTAVRDMLKSINDFRTGDDAWVWNSSTTEKIYYSNLGELTYDYDLEKAAMQRAAELAISVSHTRPDGSSCTTAYPEAFQNQYWGENIAYGYTSASTVFNMWKEDNYDYSGQGHRRNMLRENFRSIGMGCAEVNGRYYWVQEFSSKVVNTKPLLYSENKTSVEVPIFTADGKLTMSFADSSYMDNAVITMDPGDAIAVPAVNAAFYFKNYLYADLGKVKDIKSDNSYVAKISGGKLTAVNPGDALITYRSTYGSYSMTRKLNVHVTGEGIGFYDVADPEKYYYDPVYWAYEHEPVQITTGTRPNLFAPHEDVTRGQMVTFLYRLAGTPAVNGSASFSDVKVSAWYADAVAWAASRGITTGYNDAANRFGPNDICTREQIVTFLWRYADQPKPAADAAFADTEASAYYADAVSWAKEKGITTGLNDGTNRFGTGQACTRAMAVTFLYRYEKQK